MKDFKAVVGGRIKAARKAAGFSTQAELANALGVDQSRIARWETGDHLPRGPHRKRLLEALKVPDIEIFGHDEPERSYVREDNGESPKLAILARVLAMTDAEARDLLAFIDADPTDLPLDDAESAPAARRR